MTTRLRRRFPCRAFDHELVDLVRVLDSHGWSLVRLIDVEDPGGNVDVRDHYAAGRPDLFEVARRVALMSLDMVPVRVAHETNGGRSTLYLVLGESPGDLVVDYTLPGDEGVRLSLEAALTAHRLRWTGDAYEEVQS